MVNSETLYIENENAVVDIPEVEVKTKENGVHNNRLNTENGGNNVIENSHAVNKKDKEPQQHGDETDKKEENKEGEEEKGSVGLLTLFKFADSVDVLLMILATIASIGNGIAQPASFIIFGKLINEFIEFGKDPNFKIFDSMMIFAVYYCIIAAAMFVCSFAQAGLWSMAASRQIHVIRMRFFDSILRQDVGWFDVTEPGTLTTRLSADLIKIQGGIGDKIGSALQAIAMFFGGFAVGFIFSWKLTLVILATSPLLMITGALTGKVIANFTNEEQSAYAQAGSVAEEVFSSIRTVVAFSGEQAEIQRYDEKLAGAEKAGIKKGLSMGLSMGFFHMVIFSCYALAFWYGAKLVSEGEITGGDLMIVFFCVMIGASQIGHVAPNFEAVMSARGAAFIVFNIIDRKPVIDSLSDDGQSLADVKGEIQFKSVEFNYPSRPDIQILKDFTLIVRPGSTVALVGESGCGKSTAVKLVQRFYDTVQGSVTLDGIDVKDLNVRHLRSHIGVVSQEPVLFDMTIGENIKFGAINEVTQADIEKAARNSNAHDFIKALPKGYSTKVGERGVQLSGGQKQRIAIARALIRDPKILLFDEATSALDTESEGIVQAALDKVSEGRTTIIIAHRLSTVKNADQIVAVKDGKVAEMGTHVELMEKKGVYHQLVLLQTMGDQQEHPGEESELLEGLSTTEINALRNKLQRQTSVLSKGSSEGGETGKHHPSQRHMSRRLTQQLSRQTSSPGMVVGGEEDKEEEIEEEKVEPAPFFKILRLNAREWPYMVPGTFFAAIVGAFPVVFAIILSELIEIFAKSKEEIKKESVTWALAFLGLGAADFIGLFFASYLFGIAGEVLTRRLRKQVFSHVIRQNIAFFDEPHHSTGALTARLAADAAAVNGATSARLNTMTQVLVMGLTAIIIAFYYSWKLTLLVVGFAPILLLSGAAHLKIFSNFGQEQSKYLVEASALAQQAIMNVRTVASLSKETYFTQKFVGLIATPHTRAKRNSLILGLTFGLSSSMMMLANAGAFLLGGWLVENDNLPFDDMFKTILATVFGAMIAGQISSMAPNFMGAKVAAARIFKLLDIQPEIDAFNMRGETIESVKGNIEFKDIKFNYPTRPDVKVLNGLNLNISRGQKVALVGSSGCGKSTSISLLERFYNPVAGSVTLDGKPLPSLQLKWLRSQFGLVSQEPVLFARSIHDNIVYGLDTIPSQQEVEKAARKANIHDFVQGLPLGYNTMVGDKGALISGGQKQRIAIARALIRDPKIMLLDEATSALDSESEKIVQQALDSAMEGRTSIIIAHRLSTVQNSDIILVFQEGVICEAGTHQELIKQRGVYFNLNQAQF